MTIKELTKLFVNHGFEHFCFPGKPNLQGKRREKHFFIKGDCRIEIEDSYVIVKFIQNKAKLLVEGSQIGLFQDGVMFDLDSREMVR